MRSAGLLALLVMNPALLLNDKREVAERLDEATAVLRETMAVPDKAIPQELLDRAYCAVIVPGLKKGAFIVGAKYGKGFISCRNKGGRGWTALGAVRIEGGSFGFQIGGSETDIIMLVMNRRGAQRLLSSQFTLGGGAEVAAGPVGRSTGAQTDLYTTAEILSWSRARGVFAGISLKGATLRQDLDDNRALYGRTMTNKEIVEKRVAVPKEAKRLISLLDKYSERERR